MMKCFPIPFGFLQLLVLFAVFNGGHPVAEGAGKKKEYFVSLQGDDGNPGTIKQPFKSIVRVQKEIAGQVAAGVKGPVQVWLRAGVFRQERPLLFTASGEIEVSYSAYQKEKVTLSGGRVVSGWEVGKDGIWRVVLPDVKAGKWDFRALYVNGQRRQVARYPNKEYLRVLKVGEDKRTSFTAKAGDFPAGMVIAGSELVFLHDWSISRIPIASYDKKSQVVTMAYPVGPGAKHYKMDHYEQHPRFHLENSVSFLDQPGEWYLDKKSGELSYIPMPGEKMELVQVVVPFAQGLILVKGSAEKPVKNLWFHNLDFEHSGWQGAVRPYAAGQAGFHEEPDAKEKNWARTPIEPAVKFEYLQGGGMIGGRLAHLEGSGLWIGEGCKDVSLEGVTVSDVAGNGVMVGVTSSKAGLAAEKVRLKGNLIERCGIRYFGSIGLWVGMANHTEIIRNEIRHMPYTGVSVGWMWNPSDTPCFANRVEGNHIHHVMQKLSDGGGIYTLGKQPGTILKGNVIHDIPVNAGRAGSNGMFLDEGTTDIVIEGNLIYNIGKSPLRFHRAGINQVKSNILVKEEDVPTVRYNGTAEKNVILKDNRVIEQKTFDRADDGVQKVLKAAGVKN